MLPDLTFDATGLLGYAIWAGHQPADDLALEIGFGGGEHLAGLAEAAPTVNFIGAEPFVNGVASLLRHIMRIIYRISGFGMMMCG